MAEVVITGTITTSDDSDVYATHDAAYGKGGLRTVANITDRNAITVERRTEGMMVFVQDIGTYWKLLPSPWAYDNTDWEEFTSGSNVLVDNITVIKNTAGELVAVNQVHTDNITITTNTAGELEVIGQPGEWGIKNHLVPTDIIDVSPNYQYLVYGNLTIEGIMNNAGEVVIINGTVILQGLGQFNNIDLGTLKLVNLATGVSMNAVVKTLNATANTPVTINHGLGTKDFIFSAREGNDMIDIGLTHVDDNNVSITTSANITSGSIIFQSKLV
jgi:hypothetical protein